LQDRNEEEERNKKTGGEIDSVEGGSFIKGITANTAYLLKGGSITRDGTSLTRPKKKENPAEEEGKSEKGGNKS